MRIVACLLLAAFSAGAAAQTSVDYDANDNNLIDVRTSTQLEAITHDLTGVGNAAATDYGIAFPDAMQGMGCATTCTGYELLNDVDLANDSWEPIGYRSFGGSIPQDPPADVRYEATFEGNGHVIRGLRVPKPSSVEDVFIGLFSAIGENGIVRNLGLVDANISLGGDDEAAGALAGHNFGTVAACYAVGGSVGAGFRAGGLIGDNEGSIIASYASVTVGLLGTPGGGLAGRMGQGGSIVASYALGRLNPGQQSMGVQNPLDGLVGLVTGNGRVTNSYSSEALSNLPSWANQGQTAWRQMRRDLHAPTEASGIFADWDGLNIEGVDADPWDFGRPFEYPALRGVSARFPDGNTTAIEIQRQRHPAPAPARSVSLSGPSGALEEGSTAEYVMELDGGNTGTVTVVWVVEPAGAGAGRASNADFEMTRGTVDLVRIRRAVFQVTIVADDLAEPIESFRVKLDSVSGDPVLRLSASSSVVNTIALTAGSASLSGPRGPVAEGSTATYAVELDGSNPRAVTMSWSLALTGVGPGHAALADFEETTGMVTIPAGSRSGSFGVMIRADDAAREQVETFRVRLSDLRGGPAGLRLSPASSAVVSAIAPGGEDYDADGDGLIDVATLPQLNALRYDASGAGIVGVALAAVSTYVEAFAFFDPNLTCPDGCRGYELLNNLDFNTASPTTRSDDLYWNGGLGWEPMNYGGTFEGHGHVLSNLYIVNRASGLANRGLFGALMKGGVIRGVGLVDATIVSDGHPTGVLAGFTAGGSTITSSYAVGGSVTAAWGTGGLVGFHTGAMVACYAAVEARGTVVSSLVGSIGDGGSVVASYGVGRVHTARAGVGGLAGSQDGGCRRLPCTIVNSYYDTESTGLSNSNGGISKTTGNLQTPVGYDDVAGNSGQAIYAAWNVDVSGDGAADDPWDFGTFLDYPVLRSAVTANVVRQFVLQPPITLAVTLTGTATVVEGGAAEYTVRAPFALRHAATAHWSVVATSATGVAAVGDFGDGAGMQFAHSPTGTAVIAAGGDSATFLVYPFDDEDAEPAERFSVRVDRVEDAGGRVIWSTGNSAVVVSAIELSDGTDYDVDGDGLIEVATTSQLTAIRYDLGGVGLAGATSRTAYLAAFALFDAARTCHDSGGCVGYELSNDLDLSGEDWTPIGGGGDSLAGRYYTAVFEGNGYVISNLRVVRNGRLSHTGLFGAVSASGTVRNVGLRDVHISVMNHSTYIGALVGRNEGKVAASYVQGTTVSGVWAVGGLIGGNFGRLVASYADVRVHAGDAAGRGANAGGLTGEAGGASVVSASYTIGLTTGESAVGGLIGQRFLGGAVQSSYFDRERGGSSGPTDCCGTNVLNPDTTTKTSVALRAPVAPAGIYAGWDRLNVNDVDENNDGDFNDDAPWDFGTFIDYPVLRHARTEAAVQAQYSRQPAATLTPELTGDAVVSEGAAASYAVTLGGALPSGVSASWSWVVGGGMVGADDFAETSRGSVVIGAGRSSASFSVAVAVDGVAELDEAFEVSLSDAALSGDVGNTSLSAASAVPAVHTTIAANELGQVTVVAESETVAEGATATFTLRLRGGGGGDVSVNFQLVAASESVTPTDLGRMTWIDREGTESRQAPGFTGTASTGTVALRMADIATVTVVAAADGVPGESAERFGVRLTRCEDCGSVHPVEIGVPSSALVTISRIPVTVSAQVYLEGAYSSETSDMKTTLAGRLPTSQPYGVAPWNYAADTMVPHADGESGLRAITSTIVDWVLMELRASAPGAGAGATLPTTGGMAAGLLLSDGRIAGIHENATTVSEALLLDGVPVAAEFAQGADVYVLVHHRNHLAVMSAQPVAFDAAGCGGYCADFRNVPSYQGCAQLRRANGVHTMIAGDVNRSSVVSWGDDNLLLGENYSVDADLDFDGRLSRADAQLILANHLLTSECTPRRPRP